MKTTRQREQDNDLREQDQKLTASKEKVFHDLIAEQVMHYLGVPKSMIQVQVRRLWEDRYRVNVFAGAGVTSSTIVNSFFLIADSNGNIVSATPGILKQY